MKLSNETKKVVISSREAGDPVATGLPFSIKADKVNPACGTQLRESE
ncbi:MAG: hypothetical protein AB8F95_16620 [Bacteroidia bacterium]